MQDYLVGRKMTVVVHGSESCFVDVVDGVPQGSVLGSLLFYNYINLVASYLHAKCCLFADDLKLYLSLPLDKSDCATTQHLLQVNINLLYHRSSLWGLAFSPHKCSRMRFL